MLLLNLVAALAALQSGAPQNGPRFPFESTRMIATVEMSGGRMHCRVTFQSEEIPPPDGDECGFIATTGAPDSLRALGGDATLSMVIAFDPQGAPPHREDRIDRGELIGESMASYSVTSDGNIADCRQTANRVIRRMEGMRDPPDMCEFPLLQREPFAPAQGAPRRGTISLRLYLRTGAGPARP